ncbi:MAG: Gfo/Idh/MocA family protein [Hyphomicrobiaceae bacterium]
MTLKIAMIGTGRIAETKLMPALQSADGAELWSVLSRDKNRAASVAQSFGARSPNAAHDSLEALLADPELDAVLIATPDKIHAEQVIAAARARKHVFCEKPMATSVEEANAMVSACEEAGVKLGVAYHLRWHGAHRPLFQSVQEGELGDLRHIRVQWSSPAPDDSNWRARTDVGKWWSLAGVGTHCLDQILWFMTPTCGDVVDVRSIISRSVWGGPNDETALITMRFESGATADLCSSVVFAAPTRFELYGSKGYALGEGTVGTTGEGTLSNASGPIGYDYVDCYRAEIEDFAGAVRDNRAPEADGEMGARNVAILCQATD